MTIETITATALSPVRHSFCTRKGGASSGIFNGLNCGYGSSDQANIVEINRSRASHAVGATLDHLAGMNQTHSSKALVLEHVPVRPWPEADALVTRTPDMVLSVLSADCAPVLLADPEAGVIGAAHAGWRGALGGVLEATLEAMETLGASRSAVTAVVGPTISQRAYEVGPEFLETFLADDLDNARFFANGTGDKQHFDLPAFVLHRLRAARISHAEWTRHCTYSDPDRFFSYRRSVHKKEADYGRLISLIRL